jgi:hypothetical protein
VNDLTHCHLARAFCGFKTQKGKNRNFWREKDYLLIIACSKGIYYIHYSAFKPINCCQIHVFFGLKSGWLQMDLSTLEALFSFFGSHPTSINFYVFSKTY